MIKQYAYFQFDGTLDTIRSAIEDAIGIQLSERDSSYLGGTYFQFKDGVSGCRLQLHQNMDHTGEWIVPEFQGVLILCCFDGPMEAAGEYLKKLVNAGGRLLASRSKEIEDD